MNKNWVVTVDEKTFEICKDEETSETCWEFYYNSPLHKGFGVVAKTREKCIKGIIKRYKKELKELKKEVKIKNENFKKLRLFLQGSDKE